MRAREKFEQGFPLQLRVSRRVFTAASLEGQKTTKWEKPRSARARHWHWVFPGVLRSVWCSTKVRGEGALGPVVEHFKIPFDQSDVFSLASFLSIGEPLWPCSWARKLYKHFLTFMQITVTAALFCGSTHRILSKTVDILLLAIYIILQTRLNHLKDFFYKRHETMKQAL